MTKPENAVVDRDQVAAYDDAVEKADLRDIRLVSADYTSLPDIALPPHDSWKFGYNCEVEGVGYDEEAGLISAWVGAAAFCKAGRKKILNVKARYLIVWSVTHSVEQETVEKFATLLGPFAVYPYFRAHFAEITSQAGLLVPPLPIMKGPQRKVRQLVGSTYTD